MLLHRHLSENLHRSYDQVMQCLHALLIPLEVFFVLECQFGYMIRSRLETAREPMYVVIMVSPWPPSVLLQ